MRCFIMLHSISLQFLYEIFDKCYKYYKNLFRKTIRIFFKKNIN